MTCPLAHFLNCIFCYFTVLHLVIAYIYPPSCHEKVYVPRASMSLSMKQIKRVKEVNPGIREGIWTLLDIFLLLCFVFCYFTCFSSSEDVSLSNNLFYRSLCKKCLLERRPYTRWDTR